MAALGDIAGSRQIETEMFATSAIVRDAMREIRSAVTRPEAAQ